MAVRGSETSSGNNRVSIIALETFIQSTRESGYKSTASAVAELVDNSLQASSRNIDIRIEADGESGMRFAIIDDGCGMNSAILQQALRFGGTTRFDDRSSLGRFGMGLPNASLSQAKRVEVFTWQHNQPTICSYIDVDEIASGDLSYIPEPKPSSLPTWLRQPKSVSGTAVAWTKCDRLDNRRLSTITKKLHAILGRMFRHYIWAGARISINGTPVVGIDPLYLKSRGAKGLARIFQDPIEVEVYAHEDDPSRAGVVKITFTELPIEQWYSFSNEEKRSLGIANGAGVSIVRADREVDFGWFFMGDKRRENYDDWWRCEISFGPELDEAFGITHTKQQVRPKEHLVEALQSVIEVTAKALNSRVRQAYAELRSSDESSNAERIAGKKESALKPLPRQGKNGRALDELKKRHPVLRKTDRASSAVSYHLIADELESVEFFRPIYSDGKLVSVINPRHRFFKALYEPLTILSEGKTQPVGQALQLLLLSASRAETSFSNKSTQEVVEAFRREWSAVLDVMLR